MPQHGYGLPTRPQVTREVRDVTTLMERMKSRMSSWREIKLAIQAADFLYAAVLNTVVDLSLVRR